MKILEFLGFKPKSRSFDGAAKGRRTSGWKANSSSSDSEIYNSLVTLRNRSRELVRNNAVACRGLDVLTNEIVGHGIVASIIHPNPKIQIILNSEFKSWAESKNIDFLGRLDLYGLQRLAVRALLESGEVLVQEKKLNSDFRVPTSFQIMEADHLEIGDVRENGGNKIIHSIEFDKNGKRVAYHILKNHPGNSIFFNNRDKVSIPAERMAHIFKTDRPGQNRGIPILTPVMLRLRDIDEYQDAQVVKQKVAACFAAFVYDLEANPDAKDDSNLPEKIEPGIIEHLPPGKDIKFASPPNLDGYKEFLSVEFHAVAAALGLTFEALTGDLSEVNFSSARMGNMQMQRNIEVWRWQVLGPYFLDFVAAKFLETMELKGLPIEGAVFNWTPPKKEMIDPTKEVPATIKAIRAGLMTLGEAVRQSGNHLEDHLKQMAEENKLIDKYELKLDCDGRNVSLKGDLQADPEDLAENNAGQDKKPLVKKE